MILIDGLRAVATMDDAGTELENASILVDAGVIRWIDVAPNHARPTEVAEIISALDNVLSWPPGHAGPGPARSSPPRPEPARCPGHRNRDAF